MKQVPRLRSSANLRGTAFAGGPGTGTERNPELPLSISITASRTSGASPLAVFFEVVIEGTSAPARTFHHCNVHWNYGDASSGDWAYGNSLINSRDEDFSPLGSHVFEGAGPFTVTCTVTAPDGETAQDTVVISPTAEDASYPTSQTICLSSDADFTGAPSGALTQTLASGNISNATFQVGYAAGVRRFLFHAAQTFTVTDFIALGYGIANGPVHIGRFGTGADPIIQRTAASGQSIFVLSSTTATLGSASTASNDIRIVDLDMRVTGSASDCIDSLGFHQNTLVLRCNMRAASGHPIWASYDQGVFISSPPIDRNQYFFVHDNVADDSVAATAMNNFAIHGKYVSFKGNFKDGNGNNNHGVRLYFVQHAAIGHNRIRNTGLDRDVIKWSGTEWFEFPNPTFENQPYNTEYMEQICVHDNQLEVTIGSSGVSIFKGNDQYRQERSRDTIVERNYFTGIGANTLGVTCIAITTEKVTIRNNVADNTDTNGTQSKSTYFVRGGNLNTAAAPTGYGDWIEDGLGQYVEIYNNSEYVNDARDGGGGSGTTVPFWLGTGFGANNLIKNNSSYRPLDVYVEQNVVLDNSGAASVSNNGEAGDKWSTDPYVTNPIAADDDFDNGPELADAGVAVTGLFIDYAGVARDSVPNQGAFE
jgi:hypothetical protein